LAKYITAKEAALLVNDFDTVGIAAQGLAGWPDEIGEAMADRYKEEGHPANLKIKQACHTGDWKQRGTTRFGIKGMVRSWTGAHIGGSAKMCQLALEEEIATYALPQGVIINLWREIAAHRPGLITKVGIGTYIDPRIEGGKMNEAARKSEDIVRILNIDNEDYLFFPTFPVNVCILRGTTADENGNVSMEREMFLNEGYSLAAATRNTGGIVIVQVEYKVKNGAIKPKDVIIPGALVDYVVVATKEEASWQTEGRYYSPAFSGEHRVPTGSMPVLALDEKKIVARRCARELKSGMIVNLGVGMPANVASIAAEEDCIDKITLTVEGGSFGGVPAAKPDFGAVYNSEAIIPHNQMFDFYDGGGLDLAVLGLAQVDEDGNLNVSKFGPKFMGPGGFINISQASKKVVFCGSFMVGAKTKVEDGKLIIIEEGTEKKFMKKVDQITFSGKTAAANNKTVLYVTERCVFQLTKDGMELIEVAPGIDVEKDILANMEFKPLVSKDLKTMDEEIFKETWGSLKSIV
jgi:propionate CoA-transferase